MPEVELVQGWNYRWHIFEGLTGVAAAVDPTEPGTFTRIAKPERIKALTSCGEQVFVRNRYVMKRLASFNFCNKCMPVIKRRLANEVVILETEENIC